MNLLHFHNILIRSNPDNRQIGVIISNFATSYAPTITAANDAKNELIELVVLDSGDYGPYDLMSQIASVPKRGHIMGLCGCDVTTLVDYVVNTDCEPGIVCIANGRH